MQLQGCTLAVSLGLPMSLHPRIKTLYVRSDGCAFCSSSCCSLSTPQASVAGPLLRSSQIQFNCEFCCSFAILRHYRQKPSAPRCESGNLHALFMSVLAFSSPSGRPSLRLQLRRIQVSQECDLVASSPANSTWVVRGRRHFSIAVVPGSDSLTATNLGGRSPDACVTTHKDFASHNSRLLTQRSV
ncbi:hypothetical protein BDV96DRAFT_400757 [Lophiotrema nucula]|uniref:Uncharacterized protein n=1 Tax=Lophiotrema nucula TaxID=690887 RepID=A0A6A5ZES6_9PLEO|nr:hypothetical protein BDV96DRAFT_400757 [Lophiotrema nucula]